MNNRYITPEIRKADEQSRIVEFVASDSSVDSYGTVLPVDKWNLERFAKNGVIGYQHEVGYSGDPDDVIGKGTAYIEDDKLVVRVEFEPADLNEKADKIFRKVLFGSLNTVSVGFRSSKGHWGAMSNGEDPDVFYYDEMELCEVSIVNIPANANAVKRSMDEERASLPEKPVADEETVIDEAETRSEETPEAKAEPDVNDNPVSDTGDIDICLTMAEAEMALAE